MRGMFIATMEILYWIYIVIILIGATIFGYVTESTTHAIGQYLYYNHSGVFGDPDSAMAAGNFLAILIAFFIAFLVCSLIFGLHFILMDIREFTKRTAEREN